MERIIIDTDPGVDDAHAILMAFAHPSVQVEAITTVAGNVGLELTTANACIILDVLGSDVPVYAGCEQALVLQAKDAAFVHGKDGLGDAGYPPSKRPIEEAHASAALVRLANESPGELTLVAIGPLTNVAVAVKLDPQLPSKFKRLVIMGGAVNARGNTVNVSAEFNIFTDPEAAHVVFETWPELTLVSWEATMAHGFPKELVQKWLSMETPRAQFFRRTTTQILEFIMTQLGRSMLFGADALAMAVTLEPEIVKKAEKHHVSVELNGRHTRGQTTVDWMDRQGQRSNANVILEVDQDRFCELFEMGLR